MQIVTLHVDHSCPLSGPVVEARGARATHLFHRGRGVTVELHAESPGGLAALLDRYHRSGAVVVHRDSRGRSALLRFPTCPCCARGRVIAAIETAGHQYLPPVRYSATGEVYQFLVLAGPPPPTLLRTLRGSVRVTAVRTRQSDAAGLEGRFLVPWGDLVEGITEKQRTALLAGISGGYFRTPRRIGSDRLAERFEISRPAFDKLLRRAEERLLDSLAPYLAAALAAGTEAPGPRGSSSTSRTSGRPAGADRAEASRHR